MPSIKRAIPFRCALDPFNVAQNADLSPITGHPSHPAARLPGIEDWDAVVGIRLAPFYRQLNEAYPEGRFILMAARMDEWLGEVEAVRERPDSRLAWSLAQTLQVRSLEDAIRSLDQLVQCYEAYKQRVFDTFEGQPGKLLFLDLSQESGRAALEHFLEPLLPGGKF